MTKIIHTKGIQNDTAQFHCEKGLPAFLAVLYRILNTTWSGYHSVVFVITGLILLWSGVSSVEAQSNAYFRTANGVPYIPVLATPPASVSAGAFYANSTDKLTYWYDGTKWIPVDLGVMPDITLISDGILYKGRTITPDIRYIYSGTNAPATCAVSGITYTWYQATDALGTGKVTITSGTGPPSSYTVAAADVGKYIGLGVTLTTSCNTPAIEYIVWRPVVPLVPSVARVDINGLTAFSALKNNQLTASFSGYTSSPLLMPGDAGALSTYQWYYANNSLGGGKTVISGRTTSAYTVSFSDGYTAGKYIAAGVTPIAANGQVGTEIMSTWYPTAALVPAYDMAGIVGLTSGKAKNATTIAALKGVFSVTPSMSGTEATPVYKWYSATSATGTGKTAISGETSSTHTVNIGGNYGYVNDTYYLAVGITPVTTTGETGTEVMSGWVQIQVDKSADATPVNEIVSPSGRVWMDRNLGATRAATSSTDYLAYGSLYQWCRASDGHEKITWTSATTGTPVNGTTNTLSSSTIPGHSQFILGISNPYDWISPQQNNGSLWWNGTSVGVNNPCPTGYHVPTYAEWNTELSNIINVSTAYSALKLTLAGIRNSYDGALSYTGQYGEYWCSSVNGNDAWRFYFAGIGVNMYSYARTYGFSVRCIKDLDAPQAQNVSVNGIPMPGSAVIGVYTYVPPQTSGSAEGSSTYKWYVATDGIGTGKSAIAGAVAKNYTIVSPVIAGQYIAFGITPVSADGKTGTEVLSSWMQVRSSATESAPDGTLVVDLLSPSGRTWMDRNLGASRAASSSTDYLAYGSLYQWCRAADGHERITWTSSTTGTPVYGTTSTLSATAVPGHSLFITQSNSPWDWLSTQQTDGRLWWSGTVVGANNPCPTGYHIPTYAEWNTELGSITNSATAYSTLKLVLSGRHDNGGSMFDHGSIGFYWSSSINGTYSSILYFNNSSATMNMSSRANGLSVRCIKDINTTAVVDIVSPTTGRVWMDRNIGATQVATSSTDYLAYGSLFQWCRAADGHEKMTWTSATTGIPVNSTTTTLSASSIPGHSLFIVNSNNPFDWLATQLLDGTLWWSTLVTGINSPCPVGYHVPTYAEWNAELAYITNSTTAFNVLKLPMPGYRYYSSGLLDGSYVGAHGLYWTSTVVNSSAYEWEFSVSSNSMFAAFRAYGFSVRCIKNLEYPQVQSVAVSGSALVGKAVSGTYTYVPPQTTGTSEGVSVYRWYMATDASGTGKTTITGATSKVYTIASPVGAGKYIAFGVTPVSADNKTGTEVLSSWVLVSSQTTAYDGTVVNELVSPSGRIWMDRNLGATRVATSSTDYLAYGSLFQWCRPADGHEKFVWTGSATGTPVTTTSVTGPIATTNPGNSSFITTSTGLWTSVSQTDGNLWWNGTVVGSYNPCPAGYHVPTYAEWIGELSLFASNGGSNASGAYGMLKLVLAGRRNYTDGTLNQTGTIAYYWSSTIETGSRSWGLFYNTTTAYADNNSRGFGSSVRCIKDLTAPDGTLVVDLVSPSGRTWMDRSLGATQQATSSTDYLAYGSLYQWCRPSDGHQKITYTSSTAGTAVNGTTNTLSLTTTPGHSLFIISGSALPYDWLGFRLSDGSLWWSGATAGANSPCPTGYHVPTMLEWSSERVLLPSNGGDGPAGAYNILKLTLGGIRSNADGSVSFGDNGHYWSSTVNGPYGGVGVRFYGSTSDQIGAYRGLGVMVRCIKDVPLPATTDVVDIVSPSGRTWMDRNIGATRAATSSTDYLAYGSLFQWCRAADGHEKIIWTSSTTGTPVYNTYSTLSSSTSPGHSLFIVNASSPYDWLSTQQTDGKLWWNGIVAGANSPCPTGYHVPTYAEWNTELSLFSANGGANATGAYNVLKLPMVGYRNRSTNALGVNGTYGYYWSNAVSGTNAYSLIFNSSTASIGANERTFGFSVRCIKNQTDVPKAQGVLITGVASVGSTLTGGYTYVPPQLSGTSEGTSTYKWYVATDASGTGSAAISGATATTYTVTSTVVGKYIAFGVTPVSTDGKIGSEVVTNWILVSPDGTLTVDLVSPSGRIWMDRNLGASQVATSNTDYLAYGSLFQWCRGTDGHQLINRTNATSGTPVNGTTTTLSASTTPGHSLFIINASSPYDWLSAPQSNGNLWWSGSVVGANNPCPVGYHVPTYAEWQFEMNNGGVTITTNPLKLTFSGVRQYNNGALANVGVNGFYWSSSVYNVSYASYLGFSGTYNELNYNYRATSFSVRCIKN